MSKTRRNPQSEVLFLKFIESFYNSGAYPLDPGAVRGVLYSYYNIYFNELIKDFADIEHLTKNRREQEISNMRSLRPKAWRYTGNQFRKTMMVYSTTGEHLRPVTIWLGNSFIKRSLTRKGPLAQQLRKRISDKLTREIGSDAFEFWLHIERTRMDPWRLHAHGVMHFDDIRNFDRSTAQGRRVRKAIREAAGTDLPGTLQPQNQLRFNAPTFDEGWIHYCIKQRRKIPLLRDKSKEPPEEIGDPLHAGTRGLQQRTKQQYEFLRTCVDGMITGKIERWTEADWQEIEDMMPIGTS